MDDVLEFLAAFVVIPMLWMRRKRLIPKQWYARSRGEEGISEPKRRVCSIQSAVGERSETAEAEVS